MSAPADSYLSDCLVVHDSRIGYQLIFERDGSRSTWAIGARAQTGPSRVDFILCLPDKCPTARRARKSIAALHGYFYLHLELGLLMLRGLSDLQATVYQHRRLGYTIIQANRDLNRDRQGASDTPAIQPDCVMYSRENLLQFGEYDFNFVYTRPLPKWLAEAELVHTRVLRMAGGRRAT